ncbi:unnamed protein product [Caenorhabditis auriculariae]|uniref:Secreted protein n=1 Tax=Caenorhabditis auriculariae TaxID=2777116 RepID=A0A8S1HVA0_9PELO|nr:unnamed protein product [Caenorhabditis auriculariae]
MSTNLFWSFFIFFASAVRNLSLAQDEKIALNEKCYTNDYLDITPVGKDSRGVNSSVLCDYLCQPYHEWYGHHGDPVCVSNRCVCWLKSRIPVTLDPQTTTPSETTSHSWNTTDSSTTLKV